MTDFLPFYAELGRRIQQKREKLGLTQQALASLVLLSRASIANVERGKQRLMLDTFLRIAEALKMDPIDLLPEPRPAPGKRLATMLKGRPRDEQQWIRSAILSLK